jgi:hypothetical protein
LKLSKVATRAYPEGEHWVAIPWRCYDAADAHGRALCYHLALEGDGASPRCLASGMKLTTYARAYIWFMLAGLWEISAPSPHPSTLEYYPSMLTELH